MLLNSDSRRQSVRLIFDFVKRDSNRMKLMRTPYSSNGLVNKGNNNNNNNSGKFQS